VPGITGTSSNGTRLRCSSAKPAHSPGTRTAKRRVSWRPLRAGKDLEQAMSLDTHLAEVP